MYSAFLKSSTPNEISCKMNHQIKSGQSLHHPQNFSPTLFHRKAFPLIQFLTHYWEEISPHSLVHMDLYGHVCDGYQVRSSPQRR